MKLRVMRWSPRLVFAASCFGAGRIAGVRLLFGYIELHDGGLSGTRWPGLVWRRIEPGDPLYGISICLFGIGVLLRSNRRSHPAAPECERCSEFDYDAETCRRFCPDLIGPERSEGPSLSTPTTTRGRADEA